VLLLGVSFHEIVEDNESESVRITEYQHHISRYKENLVRCLMEPVSSIEQGSDLYCILVAQRMNFKPVSLTVLQRRLVADIVTALNLPKTRRLAAMFLRQRCIEHLQRDATVLRQQIPEIRGYSVDGYPLGCVLNHRSGREWQQYRQTLETFLLHTD
jgi:hypothetical protein